MPEACPLLVFTLTELLQAVSVSYQAIQRRQVTLGDIDVTISPHILSPPSLQLPSSRIYCPRFISTP